VGWGEQAEQTERANLAGRAVLQDAGAAAMANSTCVKTLIRPGRFRVESPLSPAHSGHISTPISISLADHLTPEEREQILQTIEMFESISQSNSDDYQSLEILKEAYWKIGRPTDSLAVTRRLADTYRRLGQYSSAFLEYEGMLQQNLEPSEMEEIQAILTELEAKLYPGKSAAAKPHAPIALDFGVDEAMIEIGDTAVAPIGLDEGAAARQGLEPWKGETANLIATPSTAMPKNLGRRAANVSLDSDGNEPLAKFLIQHRLVTHEIVNKALARVRERNEAEDVKEGRTLAASLLNEVVAAGVNVESLLSGIIDRTKFAYIPLEYYDIDRQIVKMLPENLTLVRLVVPFDIVSRTMMVAVDNPFDAGAKAAVQQSVDYHIQWHLAQPQIIQKVLRDVYRLSG